VGGNANGIEDAEKKDIERVGEGESEGATRMSVERATFSGI
jgi:hypothetical protein